MRSRHRLDARAPDHSFLAGPPPHERQRALSSSGSVVDARAPRAKHRPMIRTKITGTLAATFLAALSVAACHAEVRAGGEVECRNSFHRRGEVEECRTRCGNEGCRTQCVERERWAREHHCWVE